MKRTKLSSSSRKFALNSAVYLGAEVLNKLVPFLMLPIVLRYLTQSEYGLLSVVMNIIEFTTICFLLGGNAYLRVEYFKKTYPLKLVISTVLSHSTVLVMLSLFILTIGIFSFLPKTIFDLPSFWLLVIVSISFGNALIAIFLSYFQCEEKPLKVGMINVAVNVLGFAITLFLLEKGLSIDARIVAILMSVAMVSGLLVYNFRQLIIWKSSRDCTIDALAFGISSLPHGLSWWLRAGADNFVILALLSTAAVGEYAISMQLAMILLVISNALNQAMMPRMFQGLSDNKQQETRTLIGFIMGFIVVVCILMVLVSPYILNVVIPNEYQYDELVFVSLAISVLVRAGCVFSGNYFYYYKKVKVLSGITTSSALLHVPLCYAFVKAYGVIGVGFAGIASYGVTLILQIWTLKRMKVS